MQTRTVALRKESVDRNDTMQVVIVVMNPVALRKESVDRNLLFRLVAGFLLMVALRKESVDRNTNCTSIGRPKRCRSPQGERG